MSFYLNYIWYVLPVSILGLFIAVCLDCICLNVWNKPVQYASIVCLSGLSLSICLSRLSISICLSGLSLSVCLSELSPFFLDYLCLSVCLDYPCLSVCLEICEFPICLFNLSRNESAGLIYPGIQDGTFLPKLLLENQGGRILHASAR